MVTDDTTMGFWPFTAGTDDDPYPTYAWLREQEPVYRDAEGRFYAVSRYDDVRDISRDWERFSSAAGIDLDATSDHFGPNLVNSDPPPHRSLRRLLQPQFSAKAVSESLEPFVREQVRVLTEGVLGGGEVDLAHEFAWPLPFAVACHLLGLPVADHEFLWDASRRFEYRLVGDARAPDSAEAAGRELHGYMTDVVRERKRRPGGDLVSLLVTSVAEGAGLSDEELVGNTFLLFDAGTQTTACLLSNAFVMLASHPDQLRWLRAHPAAIPNAVEEFLRFETPIQHLARRATVPVNLHGTELVPGDFVALLYGAANRDPRVWADPDTLDVAREPRRTVTFGEGIHHCLGAPIARMEASIALQTLLPHMFNLSQAGDFVRLPSHELRGYVHLPVSLL